MNSIERDDFKTQIEALSHENRKLKAQLQLAEDVCESCVEHEDFQSFSSLELLRWRKSKEEK